MASIYFDLEKILNDITSKLMEDADSSRLYDVVVDIAMEATSAKACSLYLVEINSNGKDNNSEQISLVAGAGFERLRINKAKYNKGEGLTGKIWKDGNWIKCDSRKEIEDPKKGWIGKHNDIVKNEIPLWESTSLIGGPLIAGNRIIGVLKLENKDPSIGKHFTDDDFTLLKIIAGVISLAIQNRRNLEKSYSEIFSAIIDVSDMILGDHVIPVSILRQKILSKCLNIFNAEASSLYLEETSGATHKENILKMVAGEGYEKSRIGIAEYRKGEGLTGRIWQDGKSVKYDSQQDIENRKNGWLGKYNDIVRDSMQKWVCSSLMGVPLKIGERILGVLKVENKKPSPEAHFTYDELRSLEILASFIAFSLEMLRSHSDLFYKGESASSTIHSLARIVRSTECQANRIKKYCNASSECHIQVQDSINKLLYNILEISHSFQKHDQISDLKKEFVCINHLLTKNVKLFQPIAKDNGFIFEYEGPENLVYVIIIKEYIDRAIRNILSNAIDALSGVENPKIKIKAWISEQESLSMLKLTINDNGSGLDADQIKRFRENRTIRTSKHSWQGIGLPEAQSFFKANEVPFEYLDYGHKNNFLGGACFEMVFMTYKPSKVNILIIDDEPTVLDTFETHFENIVNIEIDTSMSHHSFINIIKKNNSYCDNPSLKRYDWIFLDCDLKSDVDGKTLFKIIQKNDPIFAKRILLMSAHKMYILENFDIKVYSKFDELLKDVYLDNLEANLLCGRRP